MLALFAALAVIDGRIRRSGGPGIVPFEVAATRSHAQEILSRWGPQGRDAARLSLWLDFPYLVTYGAFWTLAVTATRDVAGRLGWGRMAAVGAVLVGFPVVAAGLDALENVALLLVVGGSGGSLAPPAAAAFATGKFVTFSISVIFVLAGLLGRVGAARRQPA